MPIFNRKDGNAFRMDAEYIQSVIQMAIKSLSIRIDSEMLDKLHIIAEYEGRSANGQILILIRNCIDEYEEKLNLPLSTTSPSKRSIPDA